MPETTFEVEQLKHAPDEAGADSLFLRRWSPRAFADKDIDAKQLKAIFEAARWTASASNEQPWRFLVGQRGNQTYQKIFATLVEFNQTWAKSAPVLVLSVARKTSAEKGTPLRYNLYDTGAATANLSLQATAAGMHTHSMAGFDAELARASFGIPTDYDLGAVTAIGYLGDPATLPDYMQKMELAPRVRKPLTETVFTDWEKPAQF